MLGDALMLPETPIPFKFARFFLLPGRQAAPPGSRPVPMQMLDGGWRDPHLLPGEAPVAACVAQAPGASDPARCHLCKPGSSSQPAGQQQLASRQPARQTDRAQRSFPRPNEVF